MDRLRTILSVAIVAGIVVGWRLWWMPAGPPQHHSAVVQVSSDEPSDDPAPSPAPPALPPTVATPAPSPADKPERVTTAWEKNGCYVSEQRLDPETAELHDVYSCPSRRPEPHPYDSWSDDTLAGLAYGDAKAAEVLGLRHVVSEDRNKEALGLALLYRSVALSGDPKVFHRAIGRRYAYLSVNGEPQLHNLRQMLIFSLIGERLRGDGFDPEPIRSELVRANTPGPEIEQLRKTADRILQTMADLQSEITGETTIAEAIADA